MSGWPVTSSRRRDIERGPGPGQADDGDGHDGGRDDPAKGHPGPAEKNPEDVQKDGNRLHAVCFELGATRVAGMMPQPYDDLPGSQTEIRR